MQYYLRELRLSSGLTEKQLAKELDIPIGTILELEKGPLPTYYTHLLKLASFFHVSTDSLLNFSSYEYQLRPFDQNELLRIYSSLDDISKGKLYTRALSIEEEAKSEIKRKGYLGGRET
jgi:transcriptional regulator with XRE-family HTH domain